MSMSAYLKAALNAQLFGAGAAYVPPTTYYLAIFTTEPFIDGSGTEATGGGYARQPITWTEVGVDYLNAATISVPLNTGNYPWGAIYDAATVGHLITYGAFTTPIAMASAGTETIPANAIRALLS